MVSLPQMQNVLLAAGFTCSFEKLADNTILYVTGKCFVCFLLPLEPQVLSPWS
jgi:hypothetical protein